MSERVTTIEEWADTVRLSEPLQYGEVEAAILSRPPARSTALGVTYWLLVVVGWFGLLVAAIFGLGIALVGLACVWWGTRADSEGTAHEWFRGAQMCFLVGAVVVGFGIHAEWSERSRSWSMLTSWIVTLGSSGAAYALLKRSEWSAPGLLVAGIIASAMVAVVGLVVSAFIRPSPRNTRRIPPPRGPRSDALSGRYLQTRKAVLETLIKRGVIKVDEGDQIRLIQMPLGYWEELDGVDERERRRILEYRVVGWRDFSAADKRPWKRPRA